MPPSMNGIVLSNINTKCFDARWAVYICNGLLFVLVLNDIAERLNDSACRPPGYLVLGRTVYSRSHELQLSVISKRNCSNSNNTTLKKLIVPYTSGIVMKRQHCIFRKTRPARHTKEDCFFSLKFC